MHHIHLTSVQASCSELSHDIVLACSGSSRSHDQTCMSVGWTWNRKLHKTTKILNFKVSPTCLVWTGGDAQKCCHVLSYPCWSYPCCLQKVKYSVHLFQHVDVQSLCGSSSVFWTPSGPGIWFHPTFWCLDHFHMWITYLLQNC